MLKQGATWWNVQSPTHPSFYPSTHVFIWQPFMEHLSCGSPDLGMGKPWVRCLTLGSSGSHGRERYVNSTVRACPGPGEAKDSLRPSHFLQLWVYFRGCGPTRFLCSSLLLPHAYRSVYAHWPPPFMNPVALSQIQNPGNIWKVLIE